MFTTLTTITLGIAATCAAVIPGCEPTKTKCEPYTTIQVNSDEETPCDLDGTNQLDVFYNTNLTDDSFITICLDQGGEPVITVTAKICNDEDF